MADERFSVPPVPLVPLSPGRAVLKGLVRGLKVLCANRGDGDRAPTSVPVAVLDCSTGVPVNVAMEDFSVKLGLDCCSGSEDDDEPNGGPSRGSID